MATLAEIEALLGDWPEVDLPVALLPVRLETRFVPLGDGQVEFRLRIFPDDIHIDSFEPGLTAGETDAGRLYWQALWSGGTARAQREVAWRRLAERFDAPRAAWILRALTPVNLDELGTGAPLFPDVPQQEDAWTRPGLVRMMPDRWVACGYLGGKRILLEPGLPVPLDLAVTPAPDTSEGPEPGDAPDDQSELPLDEGMRWLVEFDAAVAQGMAIRARLTSAQAEQGFDRLTVLGLRADASGAEIFARVLEAQHYTDGVSFLPQGTPTNNTADTETARGHAGGSRAEADRIFEAATGAPLVTPGDGSNGDLTARAFGVAAEVFGGTVCADDRERAEAAAMNCAMWQAGWGSYLHEMVTAGDQHSYHPETRAHFEAFVHGRGPLPTLRIGAQPYGILPILPLARWSAGEGDKVEAALHPVLSQLREGWAREITRVPRVGRFDQPDLSRDDFLRALASDAVSLGYRARLMLSSRMFGIPGVPGFGFDFPQGTAERWNTALRVGNDLGLSSIRRFGRLIPTGHDFALSGPVVQSDLSAATLSPNYLEWLAEQSWSTVFDEDFAALGQAFEPRALLYLALRYGLLVEYAYTAGRIQVASGDLTEIDVHEPDFYDPGGTVTRPTRAMLTQGRATALGDGELRDFIHTLDASDTPEMAPVDRMRESLRTLAALPPARLDRLFRESVDLCSHRLDAWITSIAARRLERMRAARPEGLVLGGYGWLEDVRMRRSREPAEPPPGEEERVFVDPDNAGFVAAPSMTHAASAAVLRSGWMSQPDNNNPLAVDLSSRRVRLARWLLDGVRQGQPLAALLGYRFERALQDRGLAKYVAPFRRVSPLGAILAAERAVARLEADIADLPVGTPERAAAEARLAEARAHHDRLLEQRREKFLFPPGASVEAMEAVEENTVVDGLALREMWVAGAVPFGQNGLPEATGPDRSQVETVLSELDDAVDAVADAVLAESVYQTVAGNPQKVRATLAAVAAGEAPPPELEIARTPRSGFGIEHRLMILFSGRLSDAPIWPGGARSARALVEPLLESWAARLLGDPARVRLVTEWRAPDGPGPAPRMEMRLSDMPFSALDFVHLVRAQEHPESTSAAAWILHQMDRDPPADLPQGAVPALIVDRGVDWPSADLSLGEISEMARAIHAVLADARPLQPGDLAGPTGAEAAVASIADVEQRADAVRASLAADSAALETLLSTPTPDPGALMDAMLALVFYGIAASLPESARGAVDALQAQAAGAVAAAAKRLAEHDALADALQQEATAEQRRAAAVGRIQAILGRDFAVLTGFTTPEAGPLEQSFAASLSLQDGDPTAVHTWLHNAGRVREPVERLETVLDYADWLGLPVGPDSPAGDLAVAQLPHRPNDRWLGLPLEPAGPPETGAVSIVAHLVTPFRQDQPTAGLVIDRWVDVLAAPRQHAALSFNFDAPGSRPPQAVLLAVPPGDEARWSFDSIEATVQEALELAKLRAVDPSLLQRLDGFDQFLPATLFALNLDAWDSPGGVTISADLMRAAELGEPVQDL